MGRETKPLPAGMKKMLYRHTFTPYKTGRALPWKAGQKKESRALRKDVEI